MHHSSTLYRHQDGFIGRLILIVVLGAFLCVVAVRSFIAPPADFPLDSTFDVHAGDDLGTIAQNLKQAHFIKSTETFKLFMRALGSEQKVSVGSYYFGTPITSLEVALKISGKEFGILQHKVTFPEGYTNADMAQRLAARFPGFDTKTFLALAKDKQGYLFPDTYGFNPSVTPQVVYETLTHTFDRKMIPLEKDFAESHRTKEDVIIMASILEKEAANADEMPVVAGILWKRIDLGIPLQVDAPLALMLGKTSSQLTVQDLASSSPYNTYVHKGLPPKPITNPGLDAIEAALHPTDSQYLYYLHDAQGNVHYASTFDQHKQNIQKYLK